jgi:hypothetical protein
VLALFCEDDADELWRRQERINETLGVTMADLAEFLPNARTGDENVRASARKPGRSPDHGAVRPSRRSHRRV